MGDHGYGETYGKQLSASCTKQYHCIPTHGQPWLNCYLMRGPKEDLIGLLSSNQDHTLDSNRIDLGANRQTNKGIEIVLWSHAVYAKDMVDKHIIAYRS